MNEPSPYFYRRVPEQQIIDLHEFAVVQEQNHPLREYWLILERHCWLILAGAVAALVCAALYTYTRTPLYTAEATVLIERKAPQFLKVQDARTEVSENDYNTEFLKTQYEILKSRALAERVIRDEGLHSHPFFARGKLNQKDKPGLLEGLRAEIKEWAPAFLPAKSEGKQPPAAVAAESGLPGQYLSLLEVRPVSGTSLVQIKFTTPDPALSARLANAHANSYVRYGLDLRAQTNEEAAGFLRRNLIELKERVEQSEAALNSYRRDKGIISVDDKENIVVDRLLDLNKALTVAEAERIAVEAQVLTIRGRNYDELPNVLSSNHVGVLKNELTKLEGEYASLAKEFKPGYPPLDNLKVRIDEVRRRFRAEVENEVKGIEARYFAAKAKEKELRATMNEQKKATLNLKDSAVQYTVLLREVESNKQLYDGVLQRLKEIGVASQVQTSNIYLMGKAHPTTGASYPNTHRSLLIGLLLGLAGGVGLAFLLEQLDNTVKSPEEAERYMNLPSLAVVPDFTLLNGSGCRYGYGYGSRKRRAALSELPDIVSRASKSRSAVVLDHHPLSLATEAYRALRSSLLLSRAGGAPQVMLLSSATRGEGKTTTLVNTAIVFAQMGMRTLMIDGDLRRPNCHELLQMQNETGLAEVLAGQERWQSAIRPTAAENLFLMSSGTIPPNPAELLGSKMMRDVIEQLREQYEFIFIDSSPVMAVTDAVFLSAIADGTLLVVNAKTAKPLVRKARARLNTPYTNILGLLLNRVDIRTGEYGRYYYHYYNYYQEEQQPKAS